MNRIGVLGLGRSGVAVAESAVKRGAKVFALDESDQILKNATLLPKLNHPDIELHHQFQGDLAPFRLDTLVTSPGVPYYHPILQSAKSSGIEVIGEIEYAYRISKAPIVAITGTNGKSTSTVMTHLMASSAGINSVLCGNIFGSGYTEIPLTEAADTSTSAEVLVCEISSFQLEWVRQFRPVCAGITNITPDHLNRYPAGMDEYAATKRKIFGAMKEADYAVIHNGDPLTYPDESSSVTRLFYEGTDADFTKKILRVKDMEISISDLPFDSTHNRLNAMFSGLLVFGLCERMGNRNFEAGMRSIREFKGLAHRMEFIGESKGIKFINNSMCTNPGAVIASTSSLNARQHILMGGVNKDLDFSAVGEFLHSTAHQVYLFGKDAEMIKMQLNADFPVFNNLEAAFESAIHSAVSGEVVILSPGVASMDQFADFRARGDLFKELAKEWLDRS